MRINSISNQSFGKLYASKEDLAKHLDLLSPQEKEKAILCIKEIEDSDKIVAYLNGNNFDVYHLDTHYNLDKYYASANGFYEAMRRTKDDTQKFYKGVSSIYTDSDIPFDLSYLKRS